MKKTIIASFLFVWTISISSNAQEKTFITLDEVLDAAVRGNTEVTRSALDEELASAMYRQTNAVFLPQIRLSYSALSTNHPMHAFGFKLQQQSIAPSDFVPDELNYPSATQNFGALAEWDQPLINPDQMYKRRAVRKQIEAASLQKERTAEYVRFQASEAYYSLQLAYLQKQVSHQSLLLARSLLTTAEQRHEKGFLQTSDVLNARVHVLQAEVRFADSETQIQNASDRLRLIINAPGETAYQVEPMDTIGLRYSRVAELHDSRADLQAMNSIISSQEEMIRSEKNLPRLNAFAQYYLNDSDPFGFGSDAYLVGARISWDLFTGMANRNKMVGEEVRHRKLKEEFRHYRAEAAMELSRTVRGLNDLAKTIEQNKLAVEHASESLRILQDRYSQGLASTNDVLTAQNQLAQQKLNLSQTIFQGRVSEAYLEFLTSTNQ